MIEHLLDANGHKQESLENIHRRAIMEARARGLNYGQMAVELTRGISGVQGYSIQAQLRACRDWAEKHGYKVGREFLEEGYSASRNLEKRELFKEMLGEAASKSHLLTLSLA
jgi:hypothetical protein